MSLRLTGKMQLPWFDFLPTEWLNIPVEITGHRRSDASFWPAFVLAMLMAVLLGLMVHFLVFRPLRNAAPLGKVIGSVGVLHYLTGVMQLNFSSLNNPNPPHHRARRSRSRTSSWLGRGFARSSLYLAAIALLVGFGLWALYRYTRFGIATRAAAGNEKGAVLLGYSPEFLAAANWVIASVVAGFAAIIVGPFGGSLSPVQLTSLLGFFLGRHAHRRAELAHDRHASAASASA